MNRKKIVKIVCVLMVVLGSVCVSYAGNIFGGGDVFSEGNRLFADVQSFFIKVSTPAALIGVACGAFMKKFSMGDPQKIKMGSSVIFSSLIGWTVINGLTLILNTIQNYL